MVTLADGSSYDLSTSQAVTVTITSDDAEAVAPAAPTELRGKAYNGGRIDLFWSDNSDNETSFVIEWSRDGRTWGAQGTVGADVMTHAKTGLANSTFYYFRVKAVNAFGASAWSNVLRFAAQRNDGPPVLELLAAKRGGPSSSSAASGSGGAPVAHWLSLTVGPLDRHVRQRRAAECLARGWAGASRRNLALKVAPQPAPHSARRRQLLRRRCGPNVDRTGW